MYLIHFPQIAKNVTDVWAQFEDLVDAGLARYVPSLLFQRFAFHWAWKEVLQTEHTDRDLPFHPLLRLGRSIGVSNFNETVLAEVLKTARIKPAVNQIKYHAYNVDDQAKTVALCREHGILVEAYSALTPITSMPGSSRFLSLS